MFIDLLFAVHKHLSHNLKALEIFFFYKTLMVNAYEHIYPMEVVYFQHLTSYEELFVSFINENTKKWKSVSCFSSVLVHDCELNQFFFWWSGNACLWKYVQINCMQWRFDGGRGVWRSLFNIQWSFIHPRTSLKAVRFMVLLLSTEHCKTNFFTMS